MLRSTIPRRLTSLALAAALTACSEPTSPAPSVSSPSDLALGTRTSALVECPTDFSLSASAFIGPLGGEVTVGGHRIIVTSGALRTGFSLVTLIVPPSRYVEIEARVNGLPHFEFAEPVTVVVDYSRCPRSNIDQAPLKAWHIDPLTHAFIEDMGGVDDKTARTVTFSTDHFSGYAIAQ